MGRVDYKSEYSLDRLEEFAVAGAQPDSERLAEKLQALAIELKNIQISKARSGWVNAGLAEIAKSLYSSRRCVDTVFDHEGFATSPGWDVMLDLYQAHEAGKRISVSSACIGAACPPTTALRWIQALESMDLIMRVSDPTDKRRSFVQLTPKGRAATERALELYCAA